MKNTTPHFFRSLSAHNPQWSSHLPEAYLDGKMGLDAANKWPCETRREWGTPIVMDAAVDAMWGELGL